MVAASERSGCVYADVVPLNYIVAIGTHADSGTAKATNRKATNGASSGSDRKPGGGSAGR